MGRGRGCALLAALLTLAGCTVRPGWQPPLAINALPPPVFVPRYNAPELQPSYMQPSPERLTPFLQPPQRLYEPPSYPPEREPPYSDGTPFSPEAPPAPESVPSYAPAAAETPPPPVRAAAPTSTVPMVGFRPMRSAGGRSY